MSGRILRRRPARGRPRPGNRPCAGPSSTENATPRPRRARVPRPRRSRPDRPAPASMAAARRRRRESRCRERLEVAHADEGDGGLAHPADVDRLLAPTTRTFSRTRCAAGRSDRDTGAPPRRGAHEIGAARRRRQDVDVRRQLVVQAPPERLGRQRRADVEVRHLRQRVDAGIGAARAVKLEVLRPVTLRAARSISP